MMEHIQVAALLCTGMGAMFTGVAMVIRECYRGKALLLRAERGDPEVVGPPAPVASARGSAATL